MESGGAVAYQNYRVSLPCLKGQKIKYEVYGTNVSGQLKFIPMK